MDTHDLEQLSAYLDGELDAGARAAVDAHLGTCAGCRSHLEALRATATDIRALGEGVPSEQDAWALRSTIAAARARHSRYPKAVLAASGVAAVLIGFTALTLNQESRTADTGQQRGGGLSSEAGGPVSGTALSVIVLDTRYDRASARSLLTGELRSADATVVAGEPVAGEPAPRQAAKDATAPNDASAYAAQIGVCEEKIRQPSARATMYVAAFYEDVPAYFMRYEVPARSPDHIELWVVRRDNCETLLYLQDKV